MSKHLHTLVHSLDPAEKRYFRLQAGRQERKLPLNYEVFFDILLAMPEYDPAVEAAGLTRANISLRPALLRSQLKDRLLDAMRGFHARRDAEAEILRGLQDLAFLADKKLNPLLRKEIRRLRKLAGQHELYHLLIPIDDYARRLHKDTAQKDIRPGMERILEEMKDHLDLLNNQIQYTHLLDLMYVFARQDLHLRDDHRGRTIAELMEHPLLSSPELARTLTARMYFHQMHAIFHQLKGEIALAARHYSRVIGVWDAAPHFIRERPSVYRRTLGNYLSACHLLDRYHDFPDTVEKIRRSPARGLADEVEIFDLGYSYEMLFWLGSYRFEEAEMAIPAIESGLERYGEHLRQARLVYFRYNIAILFFTLERHSEALRRFRLILEEPHSGQREDLRRAVFLLRLVLLLDSGQWDLLEYELRNTARVFGQEELPRQLAEKVLAYLKRCVKAGGEGASGWPTAEFERELSEMQTDQALAQQPGYRELVCWARARARGIAVREAIREFRIGDQV